MEITQEQKLNLINQEIKDAQAEKMNYEDMMRDIRRQKREIATEKYYRMTPDWVKTVQELSKQLWLMTKTADKAPLEIPFNSVNTKEREYLRSKDVPNEYYNFQYFGVRITIWKHNTDDYSIACIGWYPTHSKRFTWRRGYAGKYAYYNRTDSIESAIVDWLLCITEFLTREIGITLDKQGRLELEPVTGESGQWGYGMQKP